MCRHAVVAMQESLPWPEWRVDARQNDTLRVERELGTDELLRLPVARHPGQTWTPGERGLEDLNAADGTALKPRTILHRPHCFQPGYDVHRSVGRGSQGGMS